MSAQLDGIRADIQRAAGILQLIVGENNQLYGGMFVSEPGRPLAIGFYCRIADGVDGKTLMDELMHWGYPCRPHADDAHCIIIYAEV